MSVGRRGANMKYLFCAPDNIQMLGTVRSFYDDDVLWASARGTIVEIAIVHLRRQIVRHSYQLLKYTTSRARIMQKQRGKKLGASRVWSENVYVRMLVK
jgi:hypothetical protein